MSENYEVMAIDDFLHEPYSKEVKIRNWEFLRERCGNRVRFEQENILSPNFSRHIDWCTHFVNLAAIAGQSGSWNSGRLYWENNVITTQLILEHLSKTNARFIHASSSSVYG
jgi:nucleoside-diphosphate-sugar epimerase